ncbi:MAG TPA: YceI family protein [Gemmatimonadaceae bacterium]
MSKIGVAVSAILVAGIGVIALDAAPARTSVLAAPHRPAAHATGPVHFVVAPKNNQARYFVREQLAHINFPSDAVGVTDSVTGSFALDDKGKIIPADSKFVVDLRGLKSDRSMRDGFIQHRTLDTEKYPTVTLVPKELQGLTMPLPDSGRVSFTLLGDLTVRGVTKPTSWMVEAYMRRGQVFGTASTGFTFEDFQIEKPKVGSVLSVADSIHLVYDFDLVPASGS